MSISTEVDIRLYNANGTRKHFPQQWIDSVEFEIGERGGCLTGTLQINVPWEQLQLAGTEYLDIRLWGSSQVIYRGWLRQTQQELATPERATPTMFGLMALLNGYQVRRDYVFGPPASIDVVFTAMAHDFVTRSGRLSSVVLDTTGVAALGITVNLFQATGKNFSDAMNALCDLSSGQLIWGCDVDGSGNNRLYLRPRATSTKYSFSVGDNVTAFAYPLDANQVVNRLFVTGGPIQPPNLPNLIQNASFEDVAQPGETTSNLLTNPSMEQVTGSKPTGWQYTNDPTIAGGAGRTGTNALDMDNNPSAPESIYQDIQVVGVQTVYQSCWVDVAVGATVSFFLKLEAFDGSNASLGSLTSTTYTLNSAVNTPLVYGQYLQSWVTPANTVKVRVTYSLTNGSASSNAINIDDCSFWTQQVTSQHWQLGAASNAYVNSIIWDFGNNLLDGTQSAPFDGDLMIKCQPVITGAGGYVEITTNSASQISVKPLHTYTIGFRVQTSSLGGPGTIQIGARIYNGSGTVISAPVSSNQTVANATSGWGIYVAQFQAPANSANADVFIRLTSGQIFYIDGAQMIEGALSAPGLAGQVLYTRDGTYRGMRDVSMYSAGQIGAAQAASISGGGGYPAWGEREADVTNDNVVDDTTCDAFAIGYFAAHAVPAVQARLTVDGAIAPVGLDGQVQLLNLPSAPPALPVAKARYAIGNSIRLELDLNNERPDQAILLRRIQSSGIGGVPWP